MDLPHWTEIMLVLLAIVVAVGIIAGVVAELLRKRRGSDIPPET